MKSPCAKALKEAVGEGVLSDAEAEQLLQRMKNLADQRSKAKGLNAFAALSEVAGELTGEMNLRAKRAERDMLLDLAQRIDATNRAKAAPSYADALLSKEIGSVKKFAGAMDSADAKGRLLEREYTTLMQAKMEAAGVWHAARRGELDAEIVRAWDNDPGADPRAKKWVEIYDEVRDMAVARANRDGADIGLLPDYRRPQSWDTVRVRNLGHEPDTGFFGRMFKKPDKIKAWTRFKAVLDGRLDEERTFNGVDGDKYLRNVFENFWNDDHSVPGELKDDALLFSHHGSVGGKLGMPRLLHFKTAADFKAVHDAIGRNVSMLDAMNSQMRQLASLTALLETWGPGGRQNRDRWIKEAIDELKADTTKDNSGQIALLKKPVIDASWHVASGAIHVSARPTVTAIVNGAKAWARLSTMGGSGVTAFFADKGFMQSALERVGMPRLDAALALVKFSMPRTAEEKNFARLFLAGIEGTIHSVGNRFSGDIELGRRMRSANDAFFHFNGLTKVTQDHRFAVAEALSHWAAIHEGADWGALPPDFRSSLEMSGVDGSTWNIYRRHGVGDTSRGRFLAEDQFGNIPDAEIDSLLASREKKPTPANRQRARDELATTWRMWLNNELSFAVPEARGREQALIYGTLKPGTFHHAVWDLMALLKSFPLAIVNTVVARDLYSGGAGRLSEAMFQLGPGHLHVATTVAYTTVLGYMAWTVKNALAGKGPPPLTDEEGRPNVDTYLASMARGGGLGILGDFALQEYDSSYKRWTQTALGPVLGQADWAMSAISKGVRGEGGGFEANRIIQSNIPGINLFYLRPALNHLILWSLDEALSPGILERRRERFEAEGGRYIGRGFFDPEKRVRAVENVLQNE